MFGRFVRDESGVALGLAVIVMVLVGVMGAGLLVVVRNDLESVVEVNQGQQAADLAEAGVQAANQEILGSNTPGNYDLDDGSGCDSAEESPPPEGEDWSPGVGGVGRDFADGRFEATIQWLNPDLGAPPTAQPRRPPRTRKVPPTSGSCPPAPTATRCAG